MGRRVKKVKSERKQEEWIFKVNVELSYNYRPKIAFLSGVERSYYPEDPGFSKFSIVHGINLDESPPCTFTPSDDRLQKPISTVGYGIGGLSASRFRKMTDAEWEQPSPDKYQQLLNEPKLKNRRRPIPPEDDYFQLPPFDPYVLRKKFQELDKKHKQCRIGFGTLKSTARFGNPPVFNAPGVGSYVPFVKDPPHLKEVNSSFGTSPIIRNPPTDIRCVPDPSTERCIECGRSLEVIDYYRTRFLVRVPLPETRTQAELDKNFPRGRQLVNLCNVCYHRAISGMSTNWPKKKVEWLFQKTRTCATIHEHKNLVEMIQKTDCKMVRRLQRKEAILSKFYSDRVDESIPAVPHYYDEQAVDVDE